MYGRRRNGGRRRRYMRRVPRNGRGFLRTGGFYGRYNGRTRRTREVKFRDYPIPLITVTGSGVELLETGLTSLQSIKEGTGQSDRIGRKIILKSIGIRLDFELNAGITSDSAHDVIRVVLVLDRQANGAAANFSDIFNTTDHNSFRDLDNPTRFTVIWDKVFSLNARTAVGNGTNNIWADLVRNIRYYKRFNIPVIFSGTTGAITEIKQNNLMLWAVSKHGGTRMTQGRIRVRFIG